MIFGWLAATVAAHGSRVLILAHRQEIVDQIGDALAAVGVPHGVIAAGRPATEAAVQIASVMTLVRRLGRYAGAFDLLVVDEAHHSAAGSWRAILDAYPSALVLGVTATPERLDGRPLDDIYAELVLGPAVKELVAEGWLSPAVTFAPPAPPDLRGIATVAGDFDIGGLAARMSTARLTGDAVEHYDRLQPQLPGLVYCASIAHSQAVAERFCMAGYAALHVDGTTPADERRDAIRRLGRGGRDGLDLITNCGLFSEGVDVPALGIVLLLRPTQSLGLYLQMIGRALRPAPGKRRALILDHAGNSLRHGLYDFDRPWSLAARQKKTAEALVRRRPACGAMVPIRAGMCAECGFVFAAGPQTVAEPEVAAGELERVDERRQLERRQLLDRLHGMPYRALLEWTAGDPARVELARQAKKYKRGWASLSRTPGDPSEPGSCPLSSAACAIAG